mgnify:FL=1|tara:strand:+ start:1067 stop:1717 length:651 start_codon:yes stop_codon:yes gene_type:complete
MKYFLFIVLANMVLCNETLNYKLKYNNIIAGRAVFKESILSNDSTDFKEVSLSVKSNKIVDIFYKLRTKVAMIVDSKEYFIYDLTRDMKEGNKTEKSYSKINYHDKIISYNQEAIKFDGQKIYSILSLIYFLKNQTLKSNDQYLINIYDREKIKPVLVKIQEEHDDDDSYFVISVKTQKENKNQMLLIVKNINNQQMLTRIELNTKNGVMELLLDE